MELHLRRVKWLLCYILFRFNLMRILRHCWFSIWERRRLKRTRSNFFSQGGKLSIWPDLSKKLRDRRIYFNQSSRMVLFLRIASKLIFWRTRIRLYLKNTLNIILCRTFCSQMAYSLFWKLSDLSSNKSLTPASINFCAEPLFPSTVLNS